MPENIPAESVQGPAIDENQVDPTLADKPKSATLLKGDRLIVQLMRYRKESDRAKKRVSQGWTELEKYSNPTQWWPEKTPRHRTKGAMNFILGLIERKAALLTDTDPIISVRSSFEHADSDYRQQMSYCSQGLELAVQHLWKRRSAGVKMYDFFQLAEIYGGCALNVPWSSKVDKRGGIDIQLIDPRQLLTDPSVSRWYNLNQSEYLIHEMMWPTDEVRDVFGVPGVTPTTGYTVDSDNEGGIFNRLRAMLGVNSGDYYSGVDRTLLSEFWFKDRQREESTKDKMFPGGRHVIIANITGRPVIVLDEPNPYIDGDFPIEFMDWHMSPNSMWGFGDVYMYRSTQEIYNKMLSLLVENATLINNWVWVGDADALTPEEWKKLTNAPGAHVKVRPGRKLAREGPPPFSAEFVQILGFLVQGMERLSGLEAAIQGRMPGSDTSGVAIESLQTASQVTIRAKARQFEDMLQRIGQHMISRIFQYVEDNRIFAITGDEKITLAYHAERERIKKFPRTYFDDYRFEVSPGSSLSSSRWQKGVLAAQLHGAGILDQKAVLDAMEYKDRDAIMDRMATARAAEMQLQLMQSQQEGTQSKVPLKGQGGRRDNQLPSTLLKRDPELVTKPVAGHPEIGG